MEIKDLAVAVERMDEVRGGTGYVLLPVYGASSTQGIQNGDVVAQGAMNIGGGANSFSDSAITQNVGAANSSTNSNAAAVGSAYHSATTIGISNSAFDFGPFWN